MTTSLAVVGAGWRAEYILRIAAMLPERFEIAGLVVRDAANAERMSAEWGAPAFSSLKELLAHQHPDFLVLSVPPSAVPELIAESLAEGVPVLTETPPAASLADLVELHRVAGSGPVQVAEQYHLQPLLSVQLALAHSGAIGAVSEARVSISHGYHAVSLIRRALGVRFEDAEIRALRYSTPLIGGPGRGGDPTEEVMLDAQTTIAHLDFGDRHGVYDWAPAQNRSWIRVRRMLLRGDSGEIDGSEVRRLEDFRTPVEYSIRRMDAGQETNLEGRFLRGLMAGESWIYRNPFMPVPFTDDEIAVAECLVRMSEYVAGGEPFYSLAEASQDHYLAMLVYEAAETGGAVRSERQVWAG